MDEIVTGKASNSAEPLRLLLDIREYDVPYYQRVSIDADLRVGSWYRVSAPRGGTSKIVKLPDMVENPGMLHS
jgi:DNA polymerase epsilon subunit 1